jgi:hypothetical protein
MPTPSAKLSPSFRFREVRPAAGHRSAEIVFRADHGRLVSVVARRRRGRVFFEFPHLHGEAGESLGDSALDDAVVARAQTIVAFWEGAAAWTRLWRSQG